MLLRSLVDGRKYLSEAVCSGFCGTVTLTILGRFNVLALLNYCRGEVRMVPSRLRGEREGHRIVRKSVSGRGTSISVCHIVIDPELRQVMTNRGCVYGGYMCLRG